MLLALTACDAETEKPPLLPPFEDVPSGFFSSPSSQASHTGTIDTIMPCVMFFTATDSALRFGLQTESEADSASVKLEINKAHTEIVSTLTVQSVMEDNLSFLTFTQYEKDRVQIDVYYSEVFTADGTTIPNGDRNQIIGKSSAEHALKECLSLTTEQLLKFRDDNSVWSSLGIENPWMTDSSR